MMTLKMIRCGKDYKLVILVSPAEATPDTPGAKFYRYATWQIGEHQPNTFNEISLDSAIGYFSGHADGLGWGELKEEPFASLEEAVQYVEDKRLEAIKEMRRELGLPEEVTDEQHQENLKRLREYFKEDRKSEGKK